ncbi:Filament-like plant protein 4 [Camellia lanceoleosa]|uniref:Filament-like plant protein 4 n=1 Tax=Camellia lanceoleosa TaxID=1840588 RepID=A0ACC0FT73_9ERIC|nr:Filament-like plant protein 4 [Camellia lanceoleosa]
MCVRSAEVANKKHLEGVKKIAKLEASAKDCVVLCGRSCCVLQRLAQMKLEVENLGRDYGETRVRRSPLKPPSPHPPQLPDFSLDSVPKFYKENDFLTEHLLAMEEETKMLKKALAMCISELQASRNICAKTASKLQILESQLHANNQQKSPSKSSLQIPTDGSLSQNVISPPSFTSMSQDGNDNERSCAGFWATTSISELSHFKGKNIEKSNKAENENHLEVMDDFVEMEKLASNDSKGAISGSDISNNMRSEMANQDTTINPHFWIHRKIMSLMRNCQYQIHNLILIHCP